MVIKPKHVGDVLM